MIRRRHPNGAIFGVDQAGSGLHLSKQASNASNSASQASKPAMSQIHIHYHYGAAPAAVAPLVKASEPILSEPDAGTGYYYYEGGTKYYVTRDVYQWTRNNVVCGYTEEWMISYDGEFRRTADGEYMTVSSEMVTSKPRFKRSDVAKYADMLLARRD